MPFERTRSHAIPRMEAVYEEFIHETGLRHVHVRRPDPERAMAFMFPTPPSNDYGIPHILEHLALCGSEKYPARDPFFSMLRRSTASFINAMTGEDYTVYPFATANENDYWNLMSVYSDATFFPNLNKLDFMQEGWREALDENGNVVIHGVVYNEMLGALNSRDARLEIALDKLWNSARPTGFVSGGEPQAIPFLTHEELLGFHREHYHPSRAIFLTYGDFDAAEAQARVEEMVLARKSWERLSPIEPVAPAKLTGAHVSVPLPQEADGLSEHSLTLLWEVESNTPQQRLLLKALGLLLFQEGGVLSRAIEEADFCRPGRMALNSEAGRGIFRIELAGLMQEDLGRARDLVKSAILELAQTTIPPEQMEATLRDFEFKERDVGGKVYGMPYGVGKIYIAGHGILMGQDGLLAFDNTEGLAELRAQLLSPGFIQTWVNTFINREPDLSVHGAPDADFQARYEEGLAKIAADRTQSLTPERRRQIEQDMKDLEARQAQSADYSALPGLTVADMPLVPRSVLPVNFVPGSASSPAELAVRIPSNGQAFVGVSLDVSSVPHEDLRWVGLLVELAPLLGVGDLTWDQAAQQRSVQAVGMHGAFSIFSPFAANDQITIEATFDASGLARDIPGMCQGLRDMLHSVRLDEKERIVQLVDTGVEEVAHSISEKGHEWSILASSAVVSPVGACKEFIAGKDHYAWLCQVNEMLHDEHRAHEVFDHLKRSHAHLLQAPLMLRSASDEPEVPAAVLRNVFPEGPGWSQLPGSLACSWQPKPAQDHALSGKTSVQYMRQVWAAPDSLQEGSGTLAVLSKVMGMEYLHSALRERGGAYGASAGYDPSGMFLMSSFRDPRLAGTLMDFEKCVQWALDGNITEEMVNSAIISSCRQSDAPLAPVASAMDAINNIRLGLTQADRERYRREVLSATPEKLQEAARKLFANPPLIRTGFINQSRTIEAQEAGLQVVPLVDAMEALPEDLPRPRMR